MTLQHKLWLAIGSCGLITLLCGGTLLLQSLRVIDITRYFPTLHPGTPAGEQAAPGEQTTSAAPAGSPADAPTATPRQGKGGADGDDAPELLDEGGAKSGEADTPASPRELGPLGSVTGTLAESPSENPGSIRTTRVKLNPAAMDWTQPGRHPKIGDRIALTLPPDNQRFVIEVVYFEERADGSGLVLYGKLEELGASVIMMTVGNKLHVRINDVAHHRIYFVSFMEGTDEYIVEECDADLQPQADTCGSEQQIQQEIGISPAVRTAPKETEENP